MFVTKFNFNDLPKKEYLHDDSDIVETAGYVSKEKMILSMINAGIRLQEVRANEFDGATVEEALENFDPTRSNDFDVVDAGRLYAELSDKLKDGKTRTSVGVSMPVNETKSEDSSDLTN